MNPRTLAGQPPNRPRVFFCGICSTSNCAFPPPFPARRRQPFSLPPLWRLLLRLLSASFSILSPESRVPAAYSPKSLGRRPFPGSSSGAAAFSFSGSEGASSSPAACAFSAASRPLYLVGVFGGFNRLFAGGFLLQPRLFLGLGFLLGETLGFRLLADARFLQPLLILRFPAAALLVFGFGLRRILAGL